MAQVTGLLSAIAESDTDVDAAVIEHVWTLAASCGDDKTMVSILSRRQGLPESVLVSARSRKEVDVRVALLSRADVDSSVLLDLLSKENRSDVFAGLVKAAATNENLASQIAQQFQSKPTKVLARAILHDGLTCDGVDFDAAMLVCTDGNQPDWLSRAVTSTSKRYLSDEARALRAADVLPFDVLTELDLIQMPAEARLRAVSRLANHAALAAEGRTDWRTRHRISLVCRKFLELAAASELSPELIAALDAVSSKDWFEDGHRLAGILATKQSGTVAVTDSRAAGRQATGKQIDELVDLVLASRNPDMQVGLLENPVITTHKQFNSLVEHTDHASLVKAVHSVRSADLLGGIWRVLGARTPEDCWVSVDNRDELLLECMRAALAEMITSGDMSPYGRGSSEVSYLLDRGVPDKAVGMLPMSVLGTSARWRYNRVLNSVLPQVVALQLKHLTTPQAWENFNNLADGWSGSLAELFDAASSL